MNKKTVLWNVLYYVLFLALFAAALQVKSTIVYLFARTGNIHVAATVNNIGSFIWTPLVIAVLVRFSLLKWYVDPIAAAIPPLWLFGGTVVFHMKYFPGNPTLLEAIRKTIFVDNGFGGLYLIGLFIVGLVASFSLARKEGKSISYRLIAPKAAAK